MATPLLCMHHVPVMRRLLPLLLLVPLAAAAQPDDERLPDLTPSVFEIQGELEIDLPQLERQPLSGFGPPPRTYVVPAQRPPATQPYGPSLDGLPTLALAPPPDPRADLPEAQALRAEAGAGLEGARYARLDASGRAGRAAFFFTGGYDGIGPSVAFGDEPPDEDGEVRFDRFDLRGGVRSTGAVRGGLEGRYARDVYTLPGLGAFATEPERTIGHAAIEGALDVDGMTSAAFRLGVAHTSVGDEGLLTEAADPAETRLTGAGHVEVLRRLVRLEGAVGTSSFSSAVSQDGLLDYEAGLVLQAHRRGGAQFALGARVLGYRVTSALADATTTTVIAPVVRAEVPVGLAARLFAYTDPGLTQRSYADLFAENPYASAPLLAPDVNTVDAQAGVEVRSGVLGLRAYGGAVFSPTRLLFVRDASGLYAPEYADARVLSLGGDVTVATATGVEATAGLAFRDGQLTDFDEAIPFFASTVGRAGLQVPFDRGRGRFGLAAYAEGSRPSTRNADGPTADGWATLSAYGAYELSGGLSVVLRGERMLGQAERWPGFPQTPFAVMAGVRYAR